MKTGRPPKYEPWMCDKMKEVMAQGLGPVHVCLALGIVKDTLYNWVNPESRFFVPEFSDAYAEARLHYQAWWEGQGNNGLWGGKAFNGNVWEFNMKNRFRDDWKDTKQNEISGSLAVPVILDDISEEKE